VVVQGVNMVKRHTKPSRAEAGGIIEKEATIHVSNVALLDPKTDKPTRRSASGSWKTAARSARCARLRRDHRPLGERAMPARLQEHYTKSVREALTKPLKEFGYKNPMQVPKLDKIVINMGVGEAVRPKKPSTAPWPT
jgi:hypothetical protein